MIVLQLTLLVEKFFSVGLGFIELRSNVFSPSELVQKLCDSGIFLSAGTHLCLDGLILLVQHGLLLTASAFVSHLMSLDILLTLCSESVKLGLHFRVQSVVSGIVFALVVGVSLFVGLSGGLPLRFGLQVSRCLLTKLRFHLIVIF